MENTETFLWLFTDSVAAALILPPRFQLVLSVMVGFGNYNKILLLLISTLGATIGSSMNYLFGIMLMSVSKDSDISQRSIAIRAKHQTRAHLIGFIAIMILGANYFPGFALQVLAGYLGMRYRLFLLSISISYLFHHVYIINNLTI